MKMLKQTIRFFVLRSCAAYYLSLGFKYIPLPLVWFLFVEPQDFIKSLGMEWLSNLFVAVSLVAFLCAFIKQQMICLKFSGKGLEYLHGITPFRHDFIELFRIVDYAEMQSIMGRIMGYKTIVIYSNDRSNPIIRMKGVKAKVPVHDLLMALVNQSRIRNNVYVSGN